MCFESVRVVCFGFIQKSLPETHPFSSQKFQPTIEYKTGFFNELCTGNSASPRDEKETIQNAVNKSVEWAKYFIRRNIDHWILWTSHIGRNSRWIHKLEFSFFGQFSVRLSFLFAEAYSSFRCLSSQFCFSGTKTFRRKISMQFIAAIDWTLSKHRNCQWFELIWLLSWRVPSNWLTDCRSQIAFPVEIRHRRHGGTILRWSQCHHYRSIAMFLESSICNLLVLAPSIKAFYLFNDSLQYFVVFSIAFSSSCNDHKFSMEILTIFCVFARAFVVNALHAVRGEAKNWWKIPVRISFFFLQLLLYLAMPSLHFHSHIRPMNDSQTHILIG